MKKLLLMIRIVLGKIIIKVLLVPALKKWFERVVQLYQMAQIENERDLLDGKQEARLNFRHYLPDTEERIERLRRVVNGRPVAILLHGPSLAELEARVIELAGCDICYLGLNEFWVPEKNILQKISRNFSLVMYSAIRSGMYSHMDDVTAFLERQEDNVLVSARESFRPLEQAEGFKLAQFIKKYDEKLLFFGSNPISSILIKDELFPQVPSIEYPLHFPRQSSFSILLSLALIGEAPLVVVFGGDGARIGTENIHYRECGEGVPDSLTEWGLTVDTRVFNVTMPLILERIYKMYDLKPAEIINCSLKSHYTPLKKLSYDETFALLKSFKKDTD